MFKHLQISEFLDFDAEYAAVVDIRDPASFSQGRIDVSQPLDQTTLPAFLENVPKDTPVVVVCYHGNSSQQAAAFLCDQGYTQVYSLDGGFEGFKAIAPQRVLSGDH